MISILSFVLSADDAAVLPACAGPDVGAGMGAGVGVGIGVTGIGMVVTTLGAGTATGAGAGAADGSAGKSASRPSAAGLWRS